MGLSMLRSMGLCVVPKYGFRPRGSCVGSFGGVGG